MSPVQTNLTIPPRLDVINTYKTQGGSIAAVLPIHYPRGLLRAFDILPVEVWGPPGIKARDGAKHLQPYVCSIVHNALSFLQSGGLDVVDILVVPHTCDSLQGLGSILLDFVVPDQPVLPIYLPRGKRESDIDFFANELRSIYRRLEAITGRTPSEAGLLQSIQREETADELLSELHRCRRNLPFSNLPFYRLLRSREYLPAETFTELARQALGQAVETKRNGIPLLLSGIVPEPMSLLGAISEMGGVIVADDLACCGRRLYPAGQSEEPCRRMAERILHAPPDPTRGNSIKERLARLMQLVETSGAKGVVFYEVKFCEPELFDLPQLRGALQEAGVPALTVEVDINDPLAHRILTRLEAFLEMIQ